LPGAESDPVLTYRVVVVEQADGFRCSLGEQDLLRIRYRAKRTVRKAKCARWDRSETLSSKGGCGNVKVALRQAQAGACRCDRAPPGAREIGSKPTLLSKDADALGICGIAGSARTSLPVPIETILWKEDQHRKGQSTRNLGPWPEPLDCGTRRESTGNSSACHAVALTRLVRQSVFFFSSIIFSGVLSVAAFCLGAGTASTA